MPFVCDVYAPFLLYAGFDTPSAKTNVIAVVQQQEWLNALYDAVCFGVYFGMVKAKRIIQNGHAGDLNAIKYHFLQYNIDPEMMLDDILLILPVICAHLFLIMWL
ncbi:hypothetical protein ACJX0J_015604 [Zea mays]